MARPRELHKLGKWLYLGVRARVRRLVQGGGGPTLDYFTKPDKVYLASADQFKGMEPIVEGEGVLQCRHFYSVVGGMGGLNILARLKNLDTITFFDINPHAVEIGRLVVELIKHAPDRDTFVSLIYGRLFDGVAYDVATQDQYYALPIEPEWTERVLTAVGPDLFKLYQEAYSPYIENPLVDQYEGISVHCTRLPLYHDAPIDGVMTHPFVERSALKEHRVTSVNSFFYGKGWLKDEARYQRVRQHLLSCEVSFAADSLEALNPPMHSGLYTSNILGAEPSAESYAAIRAVVEKFMWMLWYSHATNYLEMEYAFPPERLIPLERVYGAGIRDTHHTCEMVLDDCFDLNAKPFLEVIQPHATYGMEFGFRFYDGQRRVSARFSGW